MIVRSVLVASERRGGGGDGVGGGDGGMIRTYLCLMGVPRARADKEASAANVFVYGDRVGGRRRPQPRRGACKCTEPITRTNIGQKEGGSREGRNGCIVRNHGGNRSVHLLS